MYLQKENSVYNVLRSIKKHRSKHGMSRFFYYSNALYPILSIFSTCKEACPNSSVTLPKSRYTPSPWKGHAFKVCGKCTVSKASPVASTKVPRAIVSPRLVRTYFTVTNLPSMRNCRPTKLSIWQAISSPRNLVFSMSNHVIVTGKP